MKRAIGALVATSLAALVLAVPAAAFGIKAADVTFTNADGSPAIQAGSHPFALTNSFDGNTVIKDGKVLSDGDFKDLLLSLPPGFLVDPKAVPRCSGPDFLFTDKELPYSHCPDSTALGTVRAHAPGESGGDPGVIYNLEPPPGVALKLGFHVLQVAVTVEGNISTAPPYNALASLRNIPDVVPFGGSVATFWGSPADPAHDKERGKCFEKGGSCPIAIPERPFLFLPRSCTGPLITIFKATSWQEAEAEIEAITHDNLVPPNPLGMSGCAKLGFGPRISVQPTTAQAESPSGLDVNVDIHDEGLRSPTGIAQSDIQKAVLTFPEGVTINPSQAEGLAVCSEADLQGETLDSEFGEGCPAASKIGTVEVESPLEEGEILKGSVFVAEPYRNPTGSLIAIYVVIKDPELGILVKLPIKVEPDPKTGQLISTLEDSPQLPISRFHFHFREGGRSPLVTPPRCDTYTTKAEFTPWANPDNLFTTSSSFQITSGPGGGPCPPGGVPPFKPGFTAGSISNSAGRYSPFYMRLTRKDGEQDMTKFSSVFPPGLVGKLAGVSKCPDAAIAAAKGKTGKEELASPSCLANAKIGHVLAGAGVGPELTYVPGSVYLAGPYHGDPLSVAVITPAVAGPFDAGTVVVRVALTLNPDTAEVEADGAASDPIPHILKGIVLKVRDLRVYIDRPSFTLNPTSCDPSQTKASLFGSFLNVFDPADDVPVSLADRFQAADCASLGFKPKLSLELKGGTKRGDHPALRAVVTPRPHDANFARAVVTLPRSAFLDQGHIRTICTRVQFAAKKCPKGSIYGHASVKTPLLDEPLKGPVYLRSSNHNLPDLVVALHGIVDINAVGRIDSHKGGIRNSFETIPDAPFSRFVLNLPGGKKGLIVNSRGLCARDSRATVRFSGQNGKPDNFSSLVRASGCAKKHRR
jgi:hypothetical protein